MKTAKLYAFYEKNDLRMLDKYGNPILLKIGCTTSTVQKRVAEQTKGTIISDNIIVWGANNDKIATWYNGKNDADKIFHDFIKTRKPDAYKPTVGKEVFKITVEELDDLYNTFIKIQKHANLINNVYKVTLANSKDLINLIFEQHCNKEILTRCIYSAENKKTPKCDYENDSIFINKFANLFTLTINKLSQNPLSEPDLASKLWNYVIEYKNNLISKYKNSEIMTIPQKHLNHIYSNLREQTVNVNNKEKWSLIQY